MSDMTIIEKAILRIKHHHYVPKPTKTFKIKSTKPFKISLNNFTKFLNDEKSGYYKSASITDWELKVSKCRSRTIISISLWRDKNEFFQFNKNNKKKEKKELFRRAFKSVSNLFKMTLFIIWIVLLANHLIWKITHHECTRTLGPYFL